ncbi:MAG TPA: hypothetical protein VHV49_17495 [Pseudonocardiaceae bacterium]|nr:hypothetical protein [Pseudonocardiaceae bacterium]
MPCYAAGQGRTPSESPLGQWHRPNPAWLAGLPRDPGMVIGRLRAHLPGGDDARLPHHAGQALRARASSSANGPRWPPPTTASRPARWLPARR